MHVNSWTCMCLINCQVPRLPWIHSLQHIHPHLRCTQFYYIHYSKHMRTLLCGISHVHVCTQFSYCIVHSFTTYASLLEVQFLVPQSYLFFSSFTHFGVLCCMCCIAHGCLKKSSAVNCIDGFTASILESTSLPFSEIDLHALEDGNFFSNVWYTRSCFIRANLEQISTPSRLKGKSPVMSKYMMHPALHISASQP